VHGNGRLGPVDLGAEEDELAARVLRDGDDRANPDRLAERVVLPREALVERERDVVGRLLVVGEEEDRAGVAVFPHVGVLVHLLPREAAVAREERVRVGVVDERLADVADGEHEADRRGGRVGRPRVATLGVAVDVQGAVLQGEERVSVTRRREGERVRERRGREERGGRTVPRQSYERPSESDLGGTSGFHLPPSLCVMRVWSFLLLLRVASSGFETTLMTAMPSRPIIFSKSTKPLPLRLTYSIDGL